MLNGVLDNLVDQSSLIPHCDYLLLLNAMGSNTYDCPSGVPGKSVLDVL